MSDFPIHILSLGVGVQSSTLHLMAEVGALEPRPHHSAFCDTQDEPEKVYAFLRWLKANTALPIRTLTRGKLSDEQLRVREHKKQPGKFWAKSLIPAHVANADGTKGIMGRQCTFGHKVEVLEKNARATVGAEAIKAWRKRHKASHDTWSQWKKAAAAARKAKLQPPRFPVEAWDEMQSDPLVIQWIGISLDEIQRMKPARHPWIKHRWPLIEMEMTRHDCKRWLSARGYPEPSRSACRYCPFKSDHEWRDQRDNEPEEFAKSVQFERQLQAVKALTHNMAGIPFLHASLKPLDQVDFSTDTEKGQGMLHGFGNECDGLCGV